MPQMISMHPMSPLINLANIVFGPAIYIAHDIS